MLNLNAAIEFLIQLQKPRMNNFVIDTGVGFSLVVRQ